MVLTGSTYIALQSYLIEIYIASVTFLIKLAKTVISNSKNYKNMLNNKIAATMATVSTEEQTITCIFVHHSTEVKKQAKVEDFFFFFFYFQPILVAPDNDSL